MMLLRDIVICLFFGLCLMACQHKDEAIVTSDIYRIPLSIENGRVLVRFMAYPLKDTLLVELKRFIKDGTQYEQRTQYLKGQPVSILLYEIAPGTFRLVKEYDYLDGEKVAVVIMDQYNIDHEGHKGYELISHMPRVDFTTQRRTMREIFNKDTVFHWNGEDIASQKLDFESDDEVINRLIPFGNEKRLGRGFVIYSKGMGNTYLKLAYEKFTIELKLISIEYPDGQ